MYTRKLYLMRRVDKMTKMDTFFEEIRTCDCFLQRTISFMSKLKKLKQIGDSIIVWHHNIFEDFMGIHSDNFPGKKFFILVKKKPVVCYYNALCHADYLSYVVKDDLFDNCLIDIRLPDGTHVNCALYLENELTSFNRLCFKCKFSFLSSVSGSFHKIKRYGFQ